MKREHILQQQSPLPSEYRHLEYIESTGTQYIRPNILCGTQMNVNITCASTDISGGIILGCMNAVGRSYIGVNGKGISFAYANTYEPYYYPLPHTYDINTNQVYEFEYQSKSGDYWLKMDGVTKFTSSTSGNMPIGLEYTIFARNNNNSIGAYSKTRIYNLEVIKNESINYTFLPALRIADNKPGLYDLVNNQFYTNTGTGEFLYA